MNQNLKVGVLVGVAVSVALVAGIILGVFAGGNAVVNTSINAGGGVENDNPVFSRGLRAGQPAEQVFDANGALVNPIYSDPNNAIVTISDSSTTSTQTLTAAQVCDEPFMNVKFAKATGTLTLPSAANLITDCFKAVGITHKIALRNSSSSAAWFNIAGGASSTVSCTTTATTTPSNVSSTVPAYYVARLEGTRISSTTATTGIDYPWITWGCNIQ